MTITNPLPRKIKKISILEENLRGNIVETLIENVEGEQIAPKKDKPNPDRLEVFRKGNSLRERFCIVHYKNNDFLTLWVNGGVHISKFTLALEDVKDLSDKLSLVYSILVKNRHTKESNYEKAYNSES